MNHLADHHDVTNSDVNSNKPHSFIPPFPRNGLAKMPQQEPEEDDSTAATSSDVNLATLQNERVTFNVGGVIFQTTRATCRKKPCKRFRLADENFLAQHYDASRMEYFFDRDPEVFRSVLNFWRTGSLHLPLTVCGPHLKDELDFWGLRELDIQPCCWDSYNMWMKTVEALYKLERDRQPAYLNKGEETRVELRVKNRKWGKVSLAIWNFLTDPSYSMPAKVYAYVSLFFVILAIFSFCASTHDAFQLPVQDEMEEEMVKNETISDDNSSQTKVRPRGKDIITDSNVHPALFYIDVICLAFFTLEYLIRLICAPRRCRFIFSFSSIVDLLAILPDYVEFIIYSTHPEDEHTSAFVEFMPFLRLMRALRIFRLVRRVPGLWIMLYTLRASFKELSLMLVFLLVGTLFFSSVIYFVDDPTVFRSIPHGFWWAIVTMTTVGYGDVAPHTAWGKLVGSTTAICGVLLVGFTIPALVNNFITYYQHVEFVIKKERLLAEVNLLNECEGEEDQELIDDTDVRYRLRSTDAFLSEDTSSCDLESAA